MKIYLPPRKSVAEKQRIVADALRLGVTKAARKNKVACWSIRSWRRDLGREPYVLSSRELDVLGCIVDWMRDHASAPSYGWIAKRLGIGRSTVRGYALRAETKGYLKLSFGGLPPDCISSSPRSCARIHRDT